MSLLCRLKNLVHKGILKEKDLERIIIIPEGATVGDMIKIVFPNVEVEEVRGYTDYIGNMEFHGREVVLEDGTCINEKEWNRPYRKE